MESEATTIEPSEIRETVKRAEMEETNERADNSDVPDSPPEVEIVYCNIRGKLPRVSPPQTDSSRESFANIILEHNKLRSEFKQDPFYPPQSPESDSEMSDSSPTLSHSPLSPSPIRAPFPPTPDEEVKQPPQTEQNLELKVKHANQLEVNGNKLDPNLKAQLEKEPEIKQKLEPA